LVGATELNEKSFSFDDEFFVAKCKNKLEKKYIILII